MDDNRDEKKKVDRIYHKRQYMANDYNREKTRREGINKKTQAVIYKQIMLDIEKESYRELKNAALIRKEWRIISSFN